eukprot:6188628-Pleurochrysis_carterae.AAC.3
MYLLHRTPQFESQYLVRLSQYLISKPDIRIPDSTLCTSILVARRFGALASRHVTFVVHCIACSSAQRSALYPVRSVCAEFIPFVCAPRRRSVIIRARAGCIDLLQLFLL